MITVSYNLYYCGKCMNAMTFNEVIKYKGHQNIIAKLNIAKLLK